MVISTTVFDRCALSVKIDEHEKMTIVSFSNTTATINDNNYIPMPFQEAESFLNFQPPFFPPIEQFLFFFTEHKCADSFQLQVIIFLETVRSGAAGSPIKSSAQIW